MKADPNFAPSPPMYLITRQGGRRVDAARDEAPQFRPTFDIEPPQHRRAPPAWLGWLIAAISLAINVGLFMALAVIGGHF